MSSLDVTEIAGHAQAIVDEVEKVIVGKTTTIRKAVISLLCDGHVLLEDIPGVGKTTLAKALARSMGGDFRRIQFTPDLLPSDITGSSIFNQRESEFQFRPGPVFANVVLADEINRATPKTQSALLEAMEEKQVTIEGETRLLPRPFFVIATQNAIDMTGTYPLPEAQMDRFFSRLSLGYPEREEETAILGRQQIGHPLESVRAVTTPETLVDIQAAVRDVHVSEDVRRYIVDVVRSTRESNQFLMGSSPRGSLHLMRAAQAHAAMENRSTPSRISVLPDDVKAMASAVLAHRVMARAEIRAKGQSTEQVIDRLLSQVPAPVPVG